MLKMGWLLSISLVLWFSVLVHAHSGPVNLKIQANLVFFYYKDLPGAQEFYEKNLGFERVLDYGGASIHQISKSSFVGLVADSFGMHQITEPKSVTLAIVTNEVKEWYDYLRKHKVPMRHEFKPKEGKPYKGFVALDPEGYFLEFEMFNRHPENNNLLPILSKTPVQYPVKGMDTKRPPSLGVLSTIFWLYYEDLDQADKFYTEEFGFKQVVKQKYSNIYCNRTGSYIGLVDGAKGLHKYSIKKAVNVSFISNDIDLWYKYLSERGFEMRDKLQDSNRFPVRAFVTYDLGKYFIEFDKFHAHKKNKRIRSLLK